MDCLFVLPVFHLPVLALACSDADARHISRLKEWIAQVVITFVTCVAQMLQEEHLDGRGTRVKAACSSTDT